MRGCPNLAERNKGDRQLSVQWSDHVEGEYLAYMRVQVANQRGVLATLATTIANTASNIEHVNVTEKDGRISTIEFVVTVTDRIHLARIMKRLRRLPVVNRIWRKLGIARMANSRIIRNFQAGDPEWQKP